MPSKTFHFGLQYLGDDWYSHEVSGGLSLVLERLRGIVASGPSRDPWITVVVYFQGTPSNATLDAIRSPMQ